MAAVPLGLEQCPVCAEYRGDWLVSDRNDERSTVRVSCLCEGIVCPRCGTNRMHRPISNRYDEVDGIVLHVPYFIGWAGCRKCRSTQRSTR